MFNLVLDRSLGAWVKLNRLRTGVGRFRSDMHKWGLASSAVCECGAAEQTTDHVIRYCPLNRAPTDINGQRKLDENTTRLLGFSTPAPTSSPRIQRLGW